MRRRLSLEGAKKEVIVDEVFRDEGKSEKELLEGLELARSRREKRGSIEPGVNPPGGILKANDV